MTTRARLDELKIERVHIVGEDVDLWVRIGESRRWLGGRGRNIPSFEIFTSPDWRGTEGWIYCNQPLYRYGNIVRGIRLEFSDGRVTAASAQENERVLTEMIATEGADRIGEFSLTDRRFSRITRFMAQTLYDENVGGEFGNTHIAVGRSYQDAYDGDPNGVPRERWEELGFNNSSVHTDIVSTTDRVVTAELRGRQRARDLLGRRVPAGLAAHTRSALRLPVAAPERLATTLASGPPGGRGREAADPRRVTLVQHDPERNDDLRVELAAGATPYLRERLARGLALVYGTFAGHRVEGVAGEDDARAERDALARQAIRVAVAVIALVAGADDLRDPLQRGERRRGSARPARCGAPCTPTRARSAGPACPGSCRGSRSCRHRAVRRPARRRSSHAGQGPSAPRPRATGRRLR